MNKKLPLEDKIKLMLPNERRKENRDDVDVCYWHKAVISLQKTDETSRLYRCIKFCDGKKVTCEAYNTLNKLKNVYEHLDGLA